MNEGSLLELLPRLAGVPVLVVGDLMLDRYIWGDVSRISPEAPIPVLRVTQEESRLGGAGSVVANLVTLGAEVRAVGALGQDAAGERLLEQVRLLGLDERGLVRTAGVQTTQKTRLIARTQQLLRIDRDGEGLPAAAREELQRRALERLDGARAVLLSDYGRGVLGDEVVAALAAETRRRGIPCLADPHPSSPFARFAGVTALTPNRSETTQAVAIRPTDEASCIAAGRALIDRYGLDYATITLDRDGIYLLRRGEERGRRFPAKARAVFDVAGAGDMVLAVLGLALGAGAGLEDAVRLANVAAGLEVEKLGVTPIKPEELRAELEPGAPPALRRKLQKLPELERRLKEVRGSGGRVVFTNGCFDLLHAGHVYFLQSCRAEGEFLVVGLNTDASIRGLKGPSRPVLNLDERATLLAGLEAVDAVVPFDEPTPIALIERIRPDILCKGEDYRDKEVVGRGVVEGYGGRVQLVPLVPGLSTTAIIGRLNEGRLPG